MSAPLAQLHPAADNEAPEPVVLRLAEDQLEHLAVLIVERLPRLDRREMVDAQTLAGILGVSPDAVYDAADSLGAIRVGRPGSKRPRLIFDVDRALDAHRSVPEAAQTVRRPAGHKSTATPLLPIKD